MKPLAFILSLLIFHFALLTVFAQVSLAAPRFELQPATETNTHFTIDLLIDTNNTPTNSADVVIDFNSQILEVSQITFGSIYPQNAQNINNSTGTIYLGAFFSDPLGSLSGNGTLATLSLTGKTPGTSPFTFRCTAGATNDSNITKKDPAQDIIDCTALVNGSYTVSESTGNPTPTSVNTPTPTPTSGGTGSTPTHTPTPTPTWTSTAGGSAPSPTPTLTQLPQTASLTPTLTLIILGATLLVGSSLLLAL